jgi:hypothetical protein
MSIITKLTRNEFEQSLNAFVEKSYRVAPADQWQLKKDHFVRKQSGSLNVTSTLL